MDLERIFIHFFIFIPILTVENQPFTYDQKYLVSGYKTNIHALDLSR